MDDKQGRHLNPETGNRKKRLETGKKRGRIAENGKFSHFWLETEKNDKILVGNGIKIKWKWK
jgi:hypothetical protein